MENHVRLVFTSKNIQPDEISVSIGAKGDQVWAAGDKRSKTNLLETENGLVVESKLAKNLDLMTHIEWIISAFNGLENKLLSFSEMPECEIQLSCVVYSNGAPPLNFEKIITHWLGCIGASLDIDLYVSSSITTN
ncbi:DUF4279 domain-containing protein [Pseudomonas syringae]|uniref:DUF4279 domain-containing protein n=1 Tax=Pseudomonas syringae TaxID=317 RepID=UPI0013725F80|nr:DUF4279 domain-containing protein [Pseudomonas syringae]MBL3830051.1 DUF4279 domain-containing protein [Pseudomonas syringae pv. theae]MBL3833922.1 DUF4279 domain-containing protein [Pseudomonas syringae pv. theae]MBL3870605.1 DUF4279 domain-containing protein [Pseudomonas syringae pv. theae]NAT26486.1 hypothetical protein [Pseudomonas syringae pv. actinidifoliorum]NAT36718.1 hypothetical protein [Pseudomonas syringae pv. actinidifoliorum]